MYSEIAVEEGPDISDIPNMQLLLEQAELRANVEGSIESNIKGLFSGNSVQMVAYELKIEYPTYEQLEKKKDYVKIFIAIAMLSKLNHDPSVSDVIFFAVHSTFF